VLIWVFAILFLGFCVEGLRLRITGAGAAYAPVGAAFSVLFLPLGTALQVGLHALLWRVHLLLVLGLVAAIPYTKFLHIVTSALNIFLRQYGPPGNFFTTIDFETAETYGNASLPEFTRTQLLQLDACTRCGRCQDNCPAHLTEKPLSPKKLLQDMKAHMEATGAGTAGERQLIGDVLEHETIWACTMCLNCTEHCPVFDTTVDKTIELRRYLVMTEANFPAEAQGVFKNMENNSNPWGVGSHSRADWAKELGVKTCADGEPFDILLYTGCAGAFDDRYKKVAVAVVKIL
jgi:ferredoxin